MNITLSADAELIKKSREYAHVHNTSLNQLIRDYLLKLTGEGESEKSANEFVHLASSHPGCSDSEFKFSRDEMYDRHADK